MEKVKGVVVFDLDGTLVNTSGDIVHSSNHILKLQGRSLLEPSIIMTYVGRGAPFLISKLTGLKDGDHSKFQELLDEYQRHYAQNQGLRSRLYPGILPLLTRLNHNRYDLYILSNKPHTATVAEAKTQGIEPFFKAIFGAGSVPGLKPDPAGIHRSLELSGMPAEKAVMVGDMNLDIQTAKNAGIKSCFVTWGFGELTEEDPADVNIAGTPSELVEIIDRLVSC